MPSRLPSLLALLLLMSYFQEARDGMTGMVSLPRHHTFLCPVLFARGTFLCPVSFARGTVHLCSCLEKSRCCHPLSLSHALHVFA